MQNIVILGSTGSIGKSSLEIIRANRDKFNISCLVASTNEKLITDQAREFKKAKIYLEKKAKSKSSERTIDRKQLYDLISDSKVDTVIAAISGSDGLELTHHSIISGKKVLLANKEPLVMGGDFLMNLAKKHNSEIIPIDSEHCGVHQSINGKDIKTVSKITLTCSGGPFHSLPKSEFKTINLNKALEIIEAKYLFGIEKDKIEAIIHPEGLVHSFVEFVDGTTLASMAKPDMKIPISYGLGFPKIINNKINKVDLQKLANLSFEKIDRKKFPSIDFAYYAINQGGGMPIVLNAANELAVDYFMKEKIKFTDIFRLISSTLSYVDKNNIKLKSVSLDSILNFYDEIKEITSKNLKNFIK